jgi:hypothetical protein
MIRSLLMTAAAAIALSASTRSGSFAAGYGGVHVGLIHGAVIRDMGHAP